MWQTQGQTPSAVGASPPRAPGGVITLNSISRTKEAPETSVPALGGCFWWEGGNWDVHCFTCFWWSLGKTFLMDHIFGHGFFGRNVKWEFEWRSSISRMVVKEVYGTRIGSSAAELEMKETGKIQNWQQWFSMVVRAQKGKNFATYPFSATTTLITLQNVYFVLRMFYSPVFWGIEIEKCRKVLPQIRGSPCFSSTKWNQHTCGGHVVEPQCKDAKIVVNWGHRYVMCIMVTCKWYIYIYKQTCIYMYINKHIYICI